MSEKTLFQKIIDREIPANIEYEDDQCIVHSTPKEALVMMNGDRYDESRSTSVTEPIGSILTLVHIYSYGKGYAIYDL